MQSHRPFFIGRKTQKNGRFAASGFLVLKQ